MYKFLSMLLSVALLVAGGFYAYERYRHNQDVKQLNNQVAKIEGTLKETQTAYSARGIEIDHLKAENKDLQKKIKDRDEKIVSLTEINIKLKDQLLNIPDAHETPTTDGKIRVDFSKDNGLLKVSGYTLTGNPAYAEVKLEWLRNLKLQLILARDNNKNFRVYLDEASSDIENVDLALRIDDSIFDYKWYENILVQGQLSVGDGVNSSIGMAYSGSKFILGPVYTYIYDGNVGRRFYGLSVGWFLFRK